MLAVTAAVAALANGPANRTGSVLVSALAVLVKAT